MPVKWRKILPHDTLSGLQFFQLFRYGSVFLISIILPRAGLQPGEVGIFEAFLFFAGVVSYFWVTGLIQALLPLAGDRHSSLVTRHSQFFNASLLLLLFSILSAAVLLFAGPLLENLLHQQMPGDILWLVILYLLLFAPSTLVEYWYVISGETKKLVRYGIIAFTLQVLLVGIPVVSGGGVKGAMWGMIAAGAFRTIWLLAILGKNRDFTISFPFWKKYLALGTPILLSVLLSGSAQYVNGFIISARFEPGVFAIFRYGARELPLVALLAHALSNAIVPVIRRDGQTSGLQQLRERSSRMAGWMFPLTAVLILLAYFLFPTVYGKNYLDSAGVFNLFLLLITSRLLFPQAVLVAMERTRILMIAALLELILNVGLSLVLVQLWGIRGVALATVAAYLFERAVLMAYTDRVLGIPARDYTHLKKHLAWSFILFAAYLAAELVIYPLMRG